MAISGDFKVNKYFDTYYVSGTLTDQSTGQSQKYGDFSDPKAGGVQAQVLKENKSIAFSSAHRSGGKFAAVPVVQVSPNPKYQQVKNVLDQAAQLGKTVALTSNQDLSLQGPGGIVIEDAFIRS